MCENILPMISDFESDFENSFGRSLKLGSTMWIPHSCLMTLFQILKMSLPTVDKFLGCWELKTGVLIIGGLELVSYYV